MKKIIALILSAVMLLTLVPAVIAAPAVEEVGKVASGYTPEGVGIDSLDKITDPAGKYYLTKDITVSETFKTEFTGTFDGNGKKITTTVALFEKVNNATLKNFTVEGSISLTEAGVTAGGSEDFYAAVAIIANGKTTFKNILSDFDITTTSANTRAAAIAATSEADYDLVIDTCVNKGDISVVKYAGGIYGWTAKAGKGEVKNCANYGKVSSSGGYIGGVINRMCGTGGELTITNCANYGEVVTAKQQAGGILAYHYKSDITVTDCYNEGKIDSAGAAGGIVANLDGGEDSAPTATIKNCFNKGAISGANQLGGVLAYSNYLKGVIVVEDCQNEGTITGEGTSAYGGGIVGRVGHDNASANESSVSVKNCVNKGEVKAGKASAAGIMGWDFVRDSVYENCVNYGNLSFIEGAAAGHAGGIVANHARSDAAKETSFTIRNCVNYGKVNSNDNQAGGMVGNSNIGFIFDRCANYGKITGNYYVAGIAAQLGTDPVIKTFAYIATNCENHGDLYATAVAGQALYVGGLVSYNYCGTGDAHGILNSVNTGNIYVDSTATSAAVHVAGIVSNVTGAKYQFRNNINTGNITVNGNATYVALTFINQATNALTATENNYSVAVGTYPAGICTVTSFEAKHAKIETDKIVSGEIAHTLNTAMGTEHFYQKVGDASTLTLKEATDGSNKIVKNDDGTYSNPAKEPENPDTADVIGYAIVLGGIALVGIVFIAAQKKRTVKAK